MRRVVTIGKGSDPTAFDHDLAGQPSKSELVNLRPKKPNDDEPHGESDQAASDPN